MANSYCVYVKDQLGNTLGAVTQFKSLYLMLSVGVIGQLAIDVPYDAFPVGFFKPEGIIEVWRSIDGGRPYLIGGHLNFVRVLNAQLGSDGRKLYHIEGKDGVDQLNRNIVAYTAGTAQANKSGAVDDVMKAYVSDNMGAAATDWLGTAVGFRSDAPWITNQANLTQGPSLTKAAGQRNLLKTLQELALSAYQAGNYTVFDVVSLVPATGLAMEFRTYVQQRGIDHRFSSTTSKPVLLSAEAGNLTDLEYMKDYSGVVNTAYCGTQGYYTDPTATGLGPLARIESYVNPLSDNTLVGQNNEAAQYVRDNRLKKTWSARFVDTPGVKFGRDLDFGDFCTAQWANDIVDVRLDSFALTLDSGQERIDLVLRSDN
jgi:hypothetical protein